jgi:hypothetical protein
MDVPSDLEKAILHSDIPSWQLTGATGARISQQRYLPFGQVRTDVASKVTQTDFGYTGQRNLDAQGNQYRWD